MNSFDSGIILHTDHPRYRFLSESVEGVIRYLAGSWKFMKPPPLEPLSSTVGTRRQAYHHSGID